MLASVTGLALIPGALGPGGLTAHAASAPDLQGLLSGPDSPLAGRAQLAAREAAPFSTVAPGAYGAALAQKSAVHPAGSLAGSGGAWAPYGTAPLCDGHTTQSDICPLKDNTSLAESNGDYTISSLGHKTLSGRINSFAVDPGNPNRIWAAPTDGGVFETDDAGTTWHSIGDALPTQAMGAVAYDGPLGTILAGTGDPSFGGDGIQGHGIYYSTDDGRRWISVQGIPDLALTFRIAVSPADASGKTVYAATSKGLYKSTDGGRSYSNEMLPTSPPGYTVPDPTQGNHQVSCQGNTTAPLCFFASIVTDVVVKGSSSANAPPGAVMAVVGWRAGQKIDKNPDGSNNTSCRLKGAPTACQQAPQNGLYISPTGAAGSFAFQSHPGGLNPGLDYAPNIVAGRTSLGIAYGKGQNNDAVFALVEDAQKFQHCVPDSLDVVTVCGLPADVQGLGLATVLNGAYATYDFGKSWTKIMDYSQLRAAGGSALVGQAGYGPGVQSWYNNWIQPDPTTTDSSGNPTRVLFGLEEIWENNVNVPGVLTNPWVVNPGVGPVAPWIVIGRYWNACAALNSPPCNPTLQSSPIAGTTTHPDQHGYLFVPDGQGGVTFYAGSDGGAYKQHVRPGGDFSNDNWGDGINTGLYTLQPYDAEIARDGTVVAGLQDNGEMRIAPGGREQHTIFGGDGFMSAIDPGNSQNILEEYTYGASSLTLNGGKDWYSVAPSACSSSEALFSTSIEQDPTIPGHIVEGCTRIQEGGGTASTSVYTNPCVVPPGADPFMCQVSNTPWTTIFDLGTNTAPGVPADRNVACNIGSCVFNIPSAIGVRGANIYVGYCGYCDVVTGGLPFNSGLATNVGGNKPPKIGSSDGWHLASAWCSGCGTANGKLPKRYLTSAQIDPSDSRTVYVTLGGYARRWIPPGALGDDVTNVGNGHVFVSHDAGEHFSDISGNLPDMPANWTLVHNGQLVVATDAGVYIAPTSGGVDWTQLGTGLPNTTVFTIRLQPGNPDLMIASTFGRGVWKYTFAGPGVAAGTTSQVSASGPSAPLGLPNTAAVSSLAAPLPVGAGVALTLMLRMRRRRMRS